MILYIDTSDAEKMTIALGKNGKVVAKRSLKAKYKQAEKLLPAIDILLKKFNVQKTLDIRGIAVVKGPGPFTALRIGVATANALAYAINKEQGTSNKTTKRKISVVGISKDEYKDLDELMQKIEDKMKKAKKGSIIEPEYGKEPNITVSKKSY